LQTLEKDDVVKFYKEYIHVDAPKRAKLVVRVLAKDLEECKILNHSLNPILVFCLFTSQI